MTRYRAGGLFMTTLLFVTCLTAAVQAESSCVTCHERLSGELQGAVDLWRSGVHILSGIGCPDCHGGDGTRIQGAMSPDAGFLSRTDPRSAVAACSGCHSDPARIPLYQPHIDSADLYRAGAHGVALAAGRPAPTCASCHGSHGVLATTDPAAAVHPRNMTALCGNCHRKYTPAAVDALAPAPDGQLTDAHARGLLGKGNLQAPHCATCHGGHYTVTPGHRGSAQICGRCHQPERRLHMEGPHGIALNSYGEPGCTHCHDPHAIEPLSINALTDHFSTSCLHCHQAGSAAVKVGGLMSEELGLSLADLALLREEITHLSARGIDTIGMEIMASEAGGWVSRARSISHSVDEHRFRELTAMAKVKMIAAWDLADRSRLELRLRRLVLLFIALIAVAALSLLLLRLKLVEREQKRKLLMDDGGSPKGDVTG